MLDNTMIVYLSDTGAAHHSQRREWPFVGVGGQNQNVAAPYCRCRCGLVALVLLAGCGGPRAEPEIVWGKHGVQDGAIHMPRSLAIDADDRLFIVDFTARIQVFDRDGTFLDRCWTTPDYRNGRPSSLSFDRDGNLLVSDSHYHCVRIYSPAGKLLRTIGGAAGSAPGQFGYICAALQDKDGYYYVAEWGENQRITKLDPQGKFLKSWGSPGAEPGQFGRMRALAFGPDGNLYVADATNHRIQVFTRDGVFVRSWGSEGKEPGQLSYPYDLAFNRAGELYVLEYGAHRVQKFTADGTALGCWGGPGREPGLLWSPWALAIDSQGRVHVVDTENHRIQRIQF